MKRIPISIHLALIIILFLFGIHPVLKDFTIKNIKEVVNLSFSFFAVISIWFFNIKVFTGTYHFSYKILVCLLFTFVIGSILNFSLAKLSPINSQNFIGVIPITALAAISIISMLIIYIDTVNAERNQLSIKLEKETNAHLEAKHESLMQKLQPHFLFNALSVLKGLISEQPKTALNYVDNLSEFLRYSITDSNCGLETVENEIQNAQRYLSLQKIRFGDTFEVIWLVDSKYHKFKILYFSLQMLLENVLKHNAINESSVLTIEIKVENDYLIVSNPKRPRRVKTKSGIGLENLNKRSLLLTNEPLRINDTENWFQVALKLNK